jgi:hypothetical protein
MLGLDLEKMPRIDLPLIWLRVFSKLLNESLLFAGLGEISQYDVDLVLQIVNNVAFIAGRRAVLQHVLAEWTLSGGDAWRDGSRQRRGCSEWAGGKPMSTKRSVKPGIVVLGEQYTG